MTGFQQAECWLDNCLH